MCEVCAIFGAGEHWSDFSRVRNEQFPFGDIQHYRDERKQRLALLNRCLAAFGVTCTDWDGEATALHDAQGRFRLAPTLGDVWEQAEQLSGRIIDPLDLAFAGRPRDA